MQVEKSCHLQELSLLAKIDSGPVVNCALPPNEPSRG
jgi:hypothetical protein